MPALFTDYDPQMEKQLRLLLEATANKKNDHKEPLDFQPFIISFVT